MSALVDRPLRFIVKKFTDSAMGIAASQALHKIIEWLSSMG